MKQSTKLLSLVLALVMAFSFVGVIGNAALVKGDITYDAIDDAQLTNDILTQYQPFVLVKLTIFLFSINFYLK